VGGQSKAWNPVNGWMPVIFDDSKTQDSFSMRVFSTEEKQQAKQPQIIQYTNNFFGNVDNSQIQQGTTSSNKKRSVKVSLANRAGFFAANKDALI